MKRHVEFAESKFSGIRAGPSWPTKKIHKCPSGPEHENTKDVWVTAIGRFCRCRPPSQISHSFARGNSRGFCVVGGFFYGCSNGTYVGPYLGLNLNPCRLFDLHPATWPLTYGSVFHTGVHGTLTYQADYTLSRSRWIHVTMHNPPRRVNRTLPSPPTWPFAPIG